MLAIQVKNRMDLVKTIYSQNYLTIASTDAGTVFGKLIYQVIKLSDFGEGINCERTVELSRYIDEVLVKNV